MISSLLHAIEEVDTYLLLAINGAHSDFFDSLMHFVTNKWLWIPLSVFIAAFIFRRDGAIKGLFCIGCLVLAIAISDQVCSSLLRPAIERMRPTNPDNPISSMVHIVDGYRAGRYGFPSSHASTTIASAIYLSLWFRNRYATMTLIAWSMLLCYSRVYLGVHYPGDIICGLMIGAVAALLCWSLYIVIDRKLGLTARRRGTELAV